MNRDPPRYCGQTASFPPAQLITFLIPRALGTNHGAGVLHPGETIATIPFVGWLFAVISLALATMSQFRRKRRVVAIFIYAFFIVVTVLLAMGQYVQANAALFHAPPFNMFRVPARWLFLSNTLGCVLAATGLQLMMRLGWRSGTFMIVLAGLFLSAMGALSLKP